MRTWHCYWKLCIKLDSIYLLRVVQIMVIEYGFKNSFKDETVILTVGNFSVKPVIVTSLVVGVSWSGAAWVLPALGSYSSLREPWIPTCTVTYWSRAWDCEILYIIIYIYIYIYIYTVYIYKIKNQNTERNLKIINVSLTLFSLNEHKEEILFYNFH